MCKKAIGLGNKPRTAIAWTIVTHDTQVRIRITSTAGSALDQSQENILSQEQPLFFGAYTIRICLCSCFARLNQAGRDANGIG